MKVKIGVCMDVDGYYHAVPITNRSGIWELFTEIIYDGEYIDNINSDTNFRDFDTKSITHLTDKQWQNLIKDAEQRGTFEIVEINIEE